MSMSICLYLLLNFRFRTSISAWFCSPSIILTVQVKRFLPKLVRSPNLFLILWQLYFQLPNVISNFKLSFTFYKQICILFLLEICFNEHQKHKWISHLQIFIKFCFFFPFQFASEQMDVCQCHRIGNITIAICGIDSQIVRMWMVTWNWHGYKSPAWI